MSNILEGNNYVSKEELKRILNGSYSAVWFNPEDETFYGGETQSKGKVTPTYEAPIFSMSEFKEAKALKDAGKLDKSELPFKGWKGEYLDIFTERIGVKEAGVMTNAQFATIDTTTVGTMLLGNDIRGFSIPDVIPTVNTNGLEYQQDVYTRFNISTDVPEGVAAWSKRGDITVKSFDLTKDVGHIAATDEAQIKARKSIFSESIKNIATDFKRAKAAKQADVLETASETNVGDWDAFTAGLSDANPLAHIQARVDAIVANNGSVDTIVSTNTGWSAFVGNTNVRGAYNNQRDTMAMNSQISSVSLLPGIRWAVDNELETASVIVMDSSAVLCVNGPTRIGQYRLEGEGVDGYVARNWHQTQIVQSGRINELTTVTT